MKNMAFCLILCLVATCVLLGFTKLNALAADEIKIGTIMPSSGPLSIVGMSWTRGFEMLVEDVNTRGGVDINGKKYLLKLYNEDSKASSEAARTSALKLIHKDKVDFVLGGILEQVIEAIYGVCKNAGVLYGQTNANLPGHPADVSPDKKLQVRLFISHDDTQAIDLAYMAKNYPNVKKIAVAGPDIGYDTMVDQFKKDAGNAGMEVSFVEKWQWGTTDFIPVYTKILASKPDAILAMVSGQAQYQLMAAKQLGFDGVFISNAPLAPEVFIAVAGRQDCDKLIVNGANMQKNNDKINAVIKLWQKNYKEPFVGDSLLGYDAAWILVQAIEKAQSIDAAQVMAALDSMTQTGDLMTTHGPGKMGGMERFGCNRTLIRPIPITHFKKGKIVDSVFIQP
jgi:branched-chain amino acid transport system substrate-binding protein